MGEAKTRPSDASIEEFLGAVEDEVRRQDCWKLVALMREITGEEPRLWAGRMIGFGTYHYRYESGREGDSFLSGFATSKQRLTLYVMAGFSRYAELMERLGKFKTGKSCLYIKKLADVDEGVLRQLIEESVAHMRRTYP